MKILKREHKKGSYIGVILPTSFMAYIAGKVLDKEQIPFPKSYIIFAIKKGYLIEKEGISIVRKTKMLFPSRLNIKARISPQVAQGYKYCCNRCLTEQREDFIEFECSNCLKRCVYCRHCINMGRIAKCTKLIICKTKETVRKRILKIGYCIFPQKEHVLTWQGELTDLQQRASAQLANSLKMKKDHVVHAVCGAGKTELMFQPIYEALARGERVCLATPRTDVVLELFPRFQKAFAHTDIQALYGGAPFSKNYHSLVLATTHQLLRFNEAFDCMIVDEADAFPYTYDAVLQRAVKKAKRKDSPIALITATPSKQMLQKVQRGELNYSFIPKRFHNYPLPVPRMEPLWNYSKQLNKGRIPRSLYKWIEQNMENDRPFLLFFPSIELLEKAYPVFAKSFPTIEKVHSADKGRKDKVLLLREQKVPGLMTTTILERGITIPNIQVAVIGAENKIFDSSALIQISGRAGRSVTYPNGDIVFFHHGITAEMDEAIAKIKQYNLEAGY